MTERPPPPGELAAPVGRLRSSGGPLEVEGVGVGHHPGDHGDKINLVGMAAIGQIVGGVAQALGDGLPVPWKPAGPDGGILSQGLPGSDPSTVVKRVKAVN